MNQVGKLVAAALGTLVVVPAVLLGGLVGLALLDLAWLALRHLARLDLAAGCWSWWRNDARAGHALWIAGRQLRSARRR